MDEHAWQHKSRAILTDITAWRQAHPKATFVEIEDEVHRRLKELEAPVLQDAAQASASREWDHTSGLARCVRRVAFLWKHEASASAPCKAMEGKASS